MSLFPESSNQPAGRAILLSIKPKYADLILGGSKRVELRRSWPSNDIGVIVIYSSAPVQRLVGMAFVDRVEEHALNDLWAIAQTRGGGVTFDELKAYMSDKKTAFGVMLDRVDVAECMVDPKDIFPDFVPPQAFLYLDPKQFRQVARLMYPTRVPD